MEQRDIQIISQSSAKLALEATLAGFGAELGETSLDDFFAEFSRYHTRFFDTVIEHIASQTVQSQFPGAEVVPFPSPAPAFEPFPTPAPVVGPGPAAVPAPIPGASVANKDGLWNHVFENYDEWYDNRQDKATGRVSPKSPDFKRKSDKFALWVNSKDTPGWVRGKLGQS